MSKGMKWMEQSEHNNKINNNKQEKNSLKSSNLYIFVQKPFFHKGRRKKSNFLNGSAIKASYELNGSRIYFSLFIFSLKIVGNRFGQIPPLP